MILVLNAGGNIGRELVRELKERGAEFTVGYRKAEDVAAAAASGLRAVAADFARPETLDAAFAGANSAFFVTPPGLNLEELEGNVVAAARRARLSHLVKLSVWGAEEESTLFGRPHRAVEKRIIAAGVPYTFLRPTGFMQNMLGNAATIQGQGVFYAPLEEARVAEIDFRDIARVAAVALTEKGHIGKAYDLTGPAAMTMADRAVILSDVLGKPVSFVSPPESDWKQTLLGYGLPEWQVDGLVDLFRYYKSGRSERVTTAVADITGKSPISYRQFVEDYKEAFR